MGIVSLITLLLDIFVGTRIGLYVLLYCSVARLLFGVRLDPVSYISVLVLRPLFADRLGWIPNVLVAGPPRRLAPMISINLILVALLLSYMGHAVASRVFA